MFENMRQEISYTIVMVATIWYLICFFAACMFHAKHAQSKNYKLYQVEDVVHFFVIIEILIFASSLFVNMIVLLFASIRNVRQIPK